MKALFAALLLAGAGMAWGSEGSTDEPALGDAEADGEAVTETADAVDEQAPEDAAEAQAEAEAVESPPSGDEPARAADAPAPARRAPIPRLSFLDVQLRLARAARPQAEADLFAPVAPPQVVADGFGLLIERRFGR